MIFDTVIDIECWTHAFTYNLAQHWYILCCLLLPGRRNCGHHRFHRKHDHSLWGCWWIYLSISHWSLNVICLFFGQSIRFRKAGLFYPTSVQFTSIRKYILTHTHSTPSDTRCDYLLLLNTPQNGSLNNRLANVDYCERDAPSESFEPQLLNMRMGLEGCHSLNNRWATRIWKMYEFYSVEWACGLALIKPTKPIC